jgi:hypothetical protein
MGKTEPTQLFQGQQARQEVQGQQDRMGPILLFPAHQGRKVSKAHQGSVAHRDLS